MGFGTIWKAGREPEARLWWYDKFPENRPEIYLKFITDLELQFLRAAISFPQLSMEEIVKDVKVTQMAFPTGDDPEWREAFEDWDNAPRSIDWVLPEFLDELLSASNNVQEVAEKWNARWDADKLKDLPHAIYCLKEIIRLGKIARKNDMGVLARLAGL